MQLLKIESRIDFDKTLEREKLSITRDQLTILQVNIGKLCNQACHHCHVEAGPKRTEIMERKTIDRLLELLSHEPQITSVDITGGAPELNPHFRYFTKELRNMGKEVIDRCNLTVFSEPNQEDTPQFLADNQIRVIASLPCYSSSNVEKQRGNGVFNKSINALQTLNSLGYATNKNLQLDLVYNPLEADLPPDQAKLEATYKDRLFEDYGIKFNNLYAITNMPIKRFEHMLKRENLLEEYMQLLVDNFNIEAAKDVMCTGLVSISWDGKIYDCDFNQMLEIPINWNDRNIWDIERFSDLKGDIAFGNHCYGCAAAAGSSCKGSLS